MPLNRPLMHTVLAVLLVNSAIAQIVSFVDIDLSLSSNGSQAMLARVSNDPSQVGAQPTSSFQGSYALAPGIGYQITMGGMGLTQRYNNILNQTSPGSNGHGGSCSLTLSFSPSLPNFGTVLSSYMHPYIAEYNAAGYGGAIASPGVWDFFHVQQFPSPGAPYDVPRQATYSTATYEASSYCRMSCATSTNTLHLTGEFAGDIRVMQPYSMRCQSAELAAHVIAFTVSQPTVLSLSFHGSVLSRGDVQSFPVLPTCSVSYVYHYIQSPDLSWVDPPLALGFDFNMSGASLFTKIQGFPVGIDADNQFAVIAGGTSLGNFSAGQVVDFQALLAGPGVTAFRILGIDPAVDATSATAFPVQLAFNTPTADFTMTPVPWRKVGSSCGDPLACTSCPATTLAPVGDALAGNANFALGMQNAPTNGIGVWFVSIGSPSPNPIPLFCGEVYPQLPVINLGAAVLTGVGTCDGSASIPLPLPNQPGVFGTFLTAQSVFLCPQGGLGLSHGIEFPIGN